MSASSFRSTADQRRLVAVDTAVRVFGATGYRGTTMADVATAAGISPAYVQKLFSTKQDLFVAALDRCFDRVIEALEAGADARPGGTPAEVLDAMGDAYAHLVADRALLMLQVHAQSAADVPEIRDALRRGLRRVTELALHRADGDGEAVQRFIAFGQLCHLIVTADIGEADDLWAAAISRGITHPDR